MPKNPLPSSNSIDYDDVSPLEIERQKQAFLKKLMEINRKQIGEDKKDKLTLNEKPNAK
jgi:hypothetical protein